VESKYGMGTAEDWREMLRSFELMNRWTDQHPVCVEPEVALAMVDELYALLPAESRERRNDPTAAGARWMMSCLATLD
jgi:predicted branched-subunit amino acid permease